MKSPEIHSSENIPILRLYLHHQLQTRYRSREIDARYFQHPRSEEQNPILKPIFCQMQSFGQIDTHVSVQLE